MATLSATFTTPDQPEPGFTRAISVDDAVWSDVVSAMRESQMDGEKLSESDCINLMLREFVELHLGRATRWAAAKKPAPSFQIIA